MSLRVTAAIVLLAAPYSVLPNVVGATVQGSSQLVDRVNPRPRLLFAPGEYTRFLAELDTVRRLSLDRLVAFIDEKGTNEWNELDLQVESQALVARALLDKGDPRGHTYLSYARSSLSALLDTHTFTSYQDSHAIVTQGHRLIVAMALAHDWLYPYWSPAERAAITRWLQEEIDDWVDRDRVRAASPSPFRNDLARAVHGLVAAGLTLFDERGYEEAALKALDYAAPHYAAILAAHAYAGAGGGLPEGTFYGNFTAWAQVMIAELLYTGAGHADAFTRSPFYAARLQYAIHAAWPGFLTNKYNFTVHQLAPVFGDARRGPTGSALFHRGVVLLLGKRLAHLPAAGEAYWVVNRQETSRVYTAEFGLIDLLLWSPEVTPSEPTALVYHEATLGQVFVRSDWTDEAIWVSFNAGPHLDTHQHYDAGNLTVFREVDLLVDSGSFDAFGTPHWYNYYARTVAHNTITVTDPEERWDDLWGGVPDDRVVNDGGQRTQAPLTPAPTLDQYLANRTAYDHGVIERFTAGDWGVHVTANLTNAYQNPAFQSTQPKGNPNRVKVTHVEREWLYLRNRDRGRDAIVVHDRVVSADPGFRKAIIWHSREPFETRLRPATSAEGEKTFTGVAEFPFRATVAFDEQKRTRDGRLFLTAVAVDPIRVRQIGVRPSTNAPDHQTYGTKHYHRHVKDFFVDDARVMNQDKTTGAFGRPEWPPIGPPEIQWLWNDDLAGGWGQTRLEIEPTAPRLADQFMAVLVATDTNDPHEPDIDLLRSLDERAVGLLLRETRTPQVVLFSADPRGADLVDTVVDIPAADADLFLVDLTPNAAYALQVSCEGTEDEMVVRLQVRRAARGLVADQAGLIRVSLRQLFGRRN